MNVLFLSAVFLVSCAPLSNRPETPFDLESPHLARKGRQTMSLAVSDLERYLQMTPQKTYSPSLPLNEPKIKKDRSPKEADDFEKQIKKLEQLIEEHDL